MKIAVSTHPVMQSRPCSFCLCLQEGSVFADFDLDAARNVFLRRISFDGFGCCQLTDSARAMSAADSRMLQEAVAQGGPMIMGVEDILRCYFQDNKDLIWVDALEVHGLL